MEGSDTKGAEDRVKTTTAQLLQHAVKLIGY